MKIIFAGTSPFAARILESIAKHFDVVLIITKQDTPQGRKLVLSPSAVKQKAQELNLGVFQPVKFDIETVEKIKQIQADIMIVVAYGVLVPKKLLNYHTYGCVNIHASILPKYRGAAPIERAFLAGDEQTGISLMQMDEGLDTGDVIQVKSIKIESNDNIVSLNNKLIELSIQMVLSYLNDLVQVKILKPQKQDSTLATYAKKISKQDAKIDLNKTADQILRQIKCFAHLSGAWLELKNKKVFLLEAAKTDKSTSNLPILQNQFFKHNKQLYLALTNQEMIKIISIKNEGKKQIDALSWMNGNQNLLNQLIV